MAVTSSGSATVKGGMTAMDDLELINRYRTAGDEQALEEVVRRHIDMVYATCLRELRDAHQAEDATQATFLVLTRKAGSLPKGTVAGGWLFKTARYAAADIKRQERRRKAREERAARERQTMDSSTPDSGEVSPLLNEAM